ATLHRARAQKSRPWHPGVPGPRPDEVPQTVYRGHRRPGFEPEGSRVLGAAGVSSLFDEDAVGLIPVCPLTAAPSDRFGFHPLAESDLALLHRWLNAPHVLEWWDQPGPTPDEVERKYSPRVLREANVSAYIILRNREPIGYVQTYPVEDGTWGLRITTIAIGVDIFVGKPDLLHRGLGPRLLRRFLNDVAFSTSEIGRAHV